MTEPVPTRRQAMQMEGAIARWYTKTRNSPAQLAEFRRQAALLTRGLAGGDVLEVAPGPGYLAVELARLGRFRVTGLDMSRTLIEIADEHAREAGVHVELVQGDASAMPLPADAFDLIVCQAAFKNFGQPLRAVDEMHRALRPGGTAVIQDMNRDATAAEIAREVRSSGVRGLAGFMMDRTLRRLRRRAYSPEEFQRLAAASAFGGCEIRTEGIGMEVRLHKRPAGA